MRDSAMIVTGRDRRSGPVVAAADLTDLDVDEELAIIVSSLTEIDIELVAGLIHDNR